MMNNDVTLICDIYCARNMILYHRLYIVPISTFYLFMLKLGCSTHGHS